MNGDFKAMAVSMIAMVGIAVFYLMFVP